MEVRFVQFFYINSRWTKSWFHKFRSVDKDFGDKEDRRRTPAVDNEQLKTLFEAGPASELGISGMTVFTCKKSKKFDKRVSHELNEN